MESTKFHIGSIILEELKKQERTKSWLAKKIGYDPSNFNRILQRPHIDTNILRQISIAMEKNFGDELKRKIDADIEAKKKEKEETTNNNIY